ncbi:MAG: lysophospholipase [Pirellulales bacterium]|nr:lysophospholipase [Pirellulales bacterium]
MKFVEDYFIGRGGVRLYFQGWLPEGPRKATVAVIHGIDEHSGRYARLARRLNTHGYAVYGFDLRGHGRSSGERAWIASFEDFLDDAEAFLQRVRQEAPELPLFLLGHSMGGEVAVWLVLTRYPSLSGLILSAPALRTGGKVFPLLRRLARLVSRIFPRLRLTRLGYRFMSRDPEVIENFRTDPLVNHGKFPVRTGAEILRIMGEIQRRGGQVRLPLLVLHGTGDFVTDYRGSREFYERAASPDKTLRLYDGLYHEIFSEPERDQVIGDVISWLDARVGAPERCNE